MILSLESLIAKKPSADDDDMPITIDGNAYLLCILEINDEGDQWLELDDVDEIAHPLELSATADHDTTEDGTADIS